MTSKLQVTIPKAIAERYSIAPGDEVQWLAAADSVRVRRCRVRGYAEHYGMDELYSEDFQHDRLYGTVRVINPFL